MYKIVNATVSDIPLIRELCFQVWPQTYASMLSQDQISYMLGLMYNEKALEEQMNAGARFLFLYEEDKPVGFASYHEITPAVFKLHKIYVLPSEQGKGAGKFIIDHIVAIAVAANGKALQLQVNKQNKARSFYEKLGFAVIEEKVIDIGSGYVMDDFIMEKPLG